MSVDPFARKILDVEVVPEVCMNFRNCTRIAAGAFLTNQQTGKTRPGLWQNVDGEKLWRAGWSCPSGAIRFVTDAGYVMPRWDEAAKWRTETQRAAARKPGDPEPPW